MRRVEIANRFAAAAREAERGGKHRRAAELYAEALRALLDRGWLDDGGPDAEPCAEAGEVPSSRVNETPKDTLIRLTRGTSPEVGSAASDDRDAGSAPSGDGSDDEDELSRVG